MCCRVSREEKDVVPQFMRFTSQGCSEKQVSRQSVNNSGWLAAGVGGRERRGVSIGTRETRQEKKNQTAP